MMIEFGILSYKLFIPLLYPIFYLIKALVINKKPPSLFSYFIRSISYLLAGLVYLIILFRSKKHNKLPIPKFQEGRLSAINQVYLENQNKIKRHQIKKLTSIFLLSFIKMLQEIVEYRLSQQRNEDLFESLEILFIFLFIVLFSKIFLSSKIYRHQLISLFMISFCFLILLLINIMNNAEGDIIFPNFILIILLYLLLSGLYSLFDVLAKKHYEIYLTNPYCLMFFIGTFNLILLFLLSLLAFFNDNINEFLGLNKICEIENIYGDGIIILSFLKIIFDIIIGFFWLSGIILTLYYLTPCHFIISMSTLIFLLRLLEWIRKIGSSENYSLYLFLLEILLYSFIIFSGLIYNEIIIIRLWSLEKNTFKYISFRERLESEDSFNYYEKNLNNKSSTTDDELFDEE